MKGYSRTTRILEKKIKYLKINIVHNFSPFDPYLNHDLMTYFTSLDFPSYFLSSILSEFDPHTRIITYLKCCQIEDLDHKSTNTHIAKNLWDEEGFKVLFTLHHVQTIHRSHLIHHLIYHSLSFNFPFDLTFSFY